jgi:hypothetical protein
MAPDARDRAGVGRDREALSALPPATRQRPGTGRSRAAFASMRAAALAAEGAAGALDRWYAIGGLTLQVRCSGPALLAPLTTALGHLVARPAGRADLLVHVWDSDSTGIDVPPDPGAGDVDPYDDAARVYAVFQPDPTSMSLFVPALGEAIYWMPDVSGVTVHHRAAPLRPILHWWQRERGRQLVHGAAVSAGGRGLLLAGPSGSGKSTTALACALGGLDYLGDDYVLLGEDPGPTVYSLYSAAKLHPEHARVFPDLIPRIVNASRPTEKALWFVHDVMPERVRTHADAGAVVVPRVAGTGVTRVTPISPAQALLALAPSSIVQLSGAGDDALRFMGRFVGGLPCYRLELGREPASIADAVRALLDP